MKDKLSDKAKERIFCVTVVLVIVLFACGDQIALRMITYNPNPNNSVFGGGDISSYEISGLESLTLTEVLLKINNQETFLLLSSQEDCYVCGEYVSNLLLIKDDLKVDLYYIDKALYDNSNEELLNLRKINDSIDNNIIYTPYLMYFKNGNFTSDLVGTNELTNFLQINDLI